MFVAGFVSEQDRSICKHSDSQSGELMFVAGFVSEQDSSICKHSDESQAVTVSKVGSDKAIPVMDILMIKSIPLDVQ